jgi:ribosomal protein L37AE/L43A
VKEVRVVRLVNGTWQCVHCQAAVEMAPDKKVTAVLFVHSDRTSARALYVDREEVHRCEVRRPK